ncbi:MAG: alpha-L-rhamnosidase [Erysipelotrichaceae bacterium]|nr:alpha-L-rhamnosidase [Erysipelotrichaceae bacterium]
MGKLGPWITDGTCTPFYVRKNIEITKPLHKASAKVCGLGQFVFHANGQKVSDHELDPGWTDYRKWIEYVTFDLSDVLHQGTNTVGAEVGNGWFIKDDDHYTFTLPAFMPPNPNPYQPFGEALVFTMELTLTYADGTEEVICADESFTTAPHPVTHSNVYGSETIDHRLSQSDWDRPEFDESSWKHALHVEESKEPAGELCEQFQPPVKVLKSYAAHFLGKVKDREIYDFKQNMSGMLSVSLRGHKGDIVRFYPAEKLGEDGDVDQVAKNWVTVDSVITCILGSDNQWENFRMKFAYFAGKVVAVEKSSAEIEIKDLRADSISSAWKEAGSFECDDERFNQIYAMIERTVEANMVSVHTDCPTIERFAWQEPNHLMAPSIMFMKDGKKLWEKFLKDMRAAQHTASDVFHDYAGNAFCPGDGLMPSQAPCYVPNVLPVPGMGSFYDIIPWGSTCILGTRWHYLFYGDQKIIEDNYEAGRRYLNYLKTRMTPEGFINHGLGDWGNPDQALARENVETAFLYADAVTLAQFARILGKKEDEAELSSFAEKVRTNYNEKLLVKTDDGRWFYRNYENRDALTATQACEALPLYWNMVPEDKINDVVSCFRQTLEEKGCFASGEIGLPYIIQTASRYGLDEMIAQFILRDEHPSYYAFVKDGMTTLGEYWETNPRSHCHDMMGHIIEWYYSGIAGIKPLEPGFRKVSVNPHMPESINHFSCSYKTPYGIISVEGRRESGKPVYEIHVPEGIIRKS